MVIGSPPMLPGRTARTLTDIDAMGCSPGYTPTTTPTETGIPEFVGW